jgi:DNA-binding NtrC family response regulator
MDAKRRFRILVADDEPGIRTGLRRILNARGFDVLEAGTCAEAEQVFAETAPDLALIDQKLPDGLGIDLLLRLRERAPGVPLVVLTAYGSIELAVQAIKSGAEQFLTKPVDAATILGLVERLLDGRSSQTQVPMSNGCGSARPAAPDPFLGPSAAMQQLSEEARRIAGTERPVLLRGETGSGKGVLARWIHENGPRKKEAFVDLNCAGLSADLLGNELFGHDIGSFTGATRAKTGLLEVANRGSLFLDEIGDMEPPIQSKILKVVEEQRFRRLGEVRERQVDVRLIAATHQNIEDLMAAGRFREDLYFRLSAFVLDIPPLRDRREDVLPLAKHLLDRAAADLGRPSPSLGEDAVEHLRSHDWPGNIRELRNVVERAFVASEGQDLRAEHLKLAIRARATASPSDLLSLEDMEREHIRRVLELEQNHVARAARRLGISVSSLYERLRRYGIERPRE